MANIRLANGGGTFSSTSTWDGGAVPGTGDTFYADASSGNLTIDADTTVIAWDFTGYTGTLTISGGSVLKATGTGGGSVNCKFGSGMTLTNSGASGISFDNATASTVINLYTNGVSNPFLLRTYGEGLTVRLQDALTCGSIVNHLGATIDTNSYTLTTTGLISNNAATRTLDIDDVVISGTGTNTLNVANGSNLTITPSGTITISNTSTSTKTLALPGATSIGNLAITGGGTGAILITLDGTVANLTIGKPKTVTITSGKTLTVTGTIGDAGDASNIVTLNAATGGSAATISKASGTVSVDWWSITDSTASGGATFYAGANSTNVSGNTGWIFTAPVTGGFITTMKGWL